MAGDTGGSLPGDLREWLEDHADDSGEDPSAILTRAVALYKVTLSDVEGESGDAASMHDQLETVESRLSDVESDLDEKIDDVRMRVVQIKREADEKAHREHVHPELQASVSEATTTTESLSEQLQQLDDYVDEGFENYEDVLTYLDETVTDLDDKIQTLAQALVDLRSRTVDIEAKAQEREALSEFLRIANAHGDTKATCEACGQKIRLSLLSEPRCPACRTAFSELSPSAGFFGTARLHAGDRPALTGSETDESDVSEMLDAVADESEATDTEVDFRWQGEETAMTDGEGDD